MDRLHINDVGLRSKVHDPDDALRDAPGVYEGPDAGASGGGPHSWSSGRGQYVRDISNTGTGTIHVFSNGGSGGGGSGGDTEDIHRQLQNNAARIAELYSINDDEDYNELSEYVQSIISMGGVDVDSHVLQEQVDKLRTASDIGAGVADVDALMGKLNEVYVSKADLADQHDDAVRKQTLVKEDIEASLAQMQQDHDKSLEQAALAARSLGATLRTEWDSKHVRRADLETQQSELKAFQVRIDGMQTRGDKSYADAVRSIDGLKAHVVEQIRKAKLAQSSSSTPVEMAAHEERFRQFEDDMKTMHLKLTASEAAAVRKATLKARELTATLAEEMRQERSDLSNLEHSAQNGNFEEFKKQLDKMHGDVQKSRADIIAAATRKAKEAIAQLNEKLRVDMADKYVTEAERKRQEDVFKTHFQQTLDDKLKSTNGEVEARIKREYDQAAAAAQRSIETITEKVRLLGAAKATDSVVTERIRQETQTAVDTAVEAINVRMQLLEGTGATNKDVAARIKVDMLQQAREAAAAIDEKIRLVNASRRTDIDLMKRVVTADIEQMNTKLAGTNSEVEARIKREYAQAAAAAQRSIAAITEKVRLSGAAKATDSVVTERIRQETQTAVDTAVEAINVRMQLLEGTGATNKDVAARIKVDMLQQAREAAAAIDEKIRLVNASRRTDIDLMKRVVTADIEQMNTKLAGTNSEVEARIKREYAQAAAAAQRSIAAITEKVRLSGAAKATDSVVTERIRQETQTAVDTAVEAINVRMQLLEGTGATNKDVAARIKVDMLQQAREAAAAIDEKIRQVNASRQTDIDLMKTAVGARITTGEATTMAQTKTRIDSAVGAFGQRLSLIEATGVTNSTIEARIKAEVAADVQSAIGRINDRERGMNSGTFSTGTDLKPGTRKRVKRGVTAHPGGGFSDEPPPRGAPGWQWSPPPPSQGTPPSQQDYDDDDKRMAAHEARNEVHQY